MDSDNKKLLLVDGMALLFRAFYATAVTGQFMFNSKGVPTNGVHGFVRHLLTALTSFCPTYVAVCWDMGSKTFRTELFPDYKGNRGEPPKELIPQFDLAKEVVEAFDIPNIGIKGYEADDCIGTIAKNVDEDVKVLVLTGDKDMLQLLDNHIHVILLQKGYGNYHIQTVETFYEEAGIQPFQMVDVKALMGDPSDNYPGVRGIGEKTALKLIRQFHDVDGVVSHLDQLSMGQRTKIKQDLDMLYLSRKLAEICCYAPVDYCLHDSLFRMNRRKVLEKFQEIEFKGLERFLAVNQEPQERTGTMV